MMAVMQCRPRSLHCPDIDDTDAMVILLRAQKRLMDQFSPANPRPDIKLGDFMSREGLEALTKLNHAFTYLEDRGKYAAIRPTLYEGIIEVQ